MNFTLIIHFIGLSLVVTNTNFVDGTGCTLSKFQKTRDKYGIETSFQKEELRIQKTERTFLCKLVLHLYASCIGHESKLQYIPELPEHIKNLEFCGNQLPILNITSLRNASNLHLTNLQLSDNNIVNITPDAFTNFKYLRDLDLSKNRDIQPGDVMNALSSLKNSPMEDLYFYDIGWSEIPDEMFKSLFGTKLKSINLSINKLEFIPGNMFSGLNHLSVLNLGANKLHKMNLTGLKTVRFLILSSNLIYRIPKFCANQSQPSLVPSLEELYLDDNRIDFISKETFGCLEKLKRLMLSKNPILEIKNNCLQPLLSLETLHLSEIYVPFSKLKIEKYAFNSSSLERLYFQGNSLLSPIDYDPELLFANCRNLKYLILSYTQLPSNSHILKLLLSPLENLEDLRMDSTGLDKLPAGLFSKMNSLMSLSLKENNINSWTDTDVFKNLKLTYLGLRQNQ
ncbi:hypothetical protein KUTeg_010808 [Tegillarca granosa]|uniref:Uncharacterized protein n=1 Tax=Tegillarca granosa TaxID=220873 RepID=A0ABQ9F229_TEGGR|nr:hypothetical protein KUTeg_010808 [Tegillarca granosa]